MSGSFPIRARMINCDEGQPRCSRCVSKNQDCNYAHLGSAYNPFQYQLAIVAGSSSGSSPTIAGSEQSPPKEVLAAVDKTPQANKQLYEHYITAVSPILTGASKEDGLHHWDSAIRKFSHSHDYLYFIVLAFAALHSAIGSDHASIRQTYLDVALNHQNSALERFRPILSDINTDNCEPALTCAGLIVACSFAVPLATSKTDSNDRSQLQQLKRVVSLFDGVVKLYRMGWKTSPDSNISPFIRARVVALWSEEQPAPEAEASLGYLAQHVAQLLEDVSKRDMYILTIEKMKRTHRRLMWTPNAVTVVLFWPGMVPTRYFTALEAQEPIAMIILAHWAVCLHHCSQFFWIGGWGKWTVTTVAETLDEQWQRFLEWPKSQVA
ncbi:hypothetical protein NA57DRAFT_55269 [Rhizodiscina lignyota]|uniref:Zn(2)-C6 fungal-type domain-containing protein n=1 Tax=Rhizodiscina lignyota TaxID=1504668 RepID=A0A9P4M628_9PEZI|nr:hypothetical protein NA57DRAFT_55269 [Rhizodiscina lignyota]